MLEKKKSDKKVDIIEIKGILNKYRNFYYNSDKKEERELANAINDLFIYLNKQEENLREELKKNMTIDVFKESPLENVEFLASISFFSSLVANKDDVIKNHLKEEFIEDFIYTILNKEG